METTIANRNRASASMEGPQRKLVANTNENRSVSPNQWTRRSFARMFALGVSVRRIARANHCTEEAVRREIRQQMLADLMDDRRIA